jgi:hypothetical protein
LILGNQQLNAMTKKTLFLLIIVLIMFCLPACQKQDTKIQALDGTWTEVDTQTDTIVFSSNTMPGLLLLNRGYEIRNGYNLPKLGSGPYTYEISNDSIKLQWTASSSFNNFKYFFKFNESSETFNIQVFTSFATNKAILTFKKVK